MTDTEKPKKKCPQCDKMYTPYRISQIYCSKECKNKKHYGERAAAWKAFKEQQK